MEVGRRRVPCNRVCHTESFACSACDAGPVSDGYDGIPDDYFGQEPDRFYAQIGRVVVDAALVELHLLYLVWTLDQESPQELHAGRTSAQLLAIGRERLRRFPELTVEGERLLCQVQAVSERRNAIVHNVWPTPGLREAYGHRPLPKSRRGKDGRWIADGIVTAEDLDRLIADLVDVVEAMMRFRERC
jgi:hypothetical protein